MGRLPVDTVRIGIYSQVDSLRFAPIHVADQRGYFQENGIDPQYVFQHGPGIQTALANGEVDVAPTTVERMLKAYGQDVPFRIVASAETWGPGKGPHHFVAQPALLERGELRDYPDLKGKRIGLEKNRVDPDWLIAHRALDRAGITMDDVEVVWATHGERREKSLEAQGIDVTIFMQPAAIAAGLRQGNIAIWRQCGELFPGRQGQLLGYASAFATERADVARRWMVAYVRGVRTYLDAVEEGKDRDGLVDLLTRATGDARETVELMPSLGIARDARVNGAAMQEEADLFGANGFLPAGLKIAPTVDNQFVDHAAGAA
jgi:NitT/TauT family transport system substrate-binding protein